ncbi:cold-shock protein [Nocardia sp. alder85J]|uniref:cold-shock protein n=1 Tax=Nocardia sp. alder85J TaxID=2862949 RepID=UPI001CD1E74C|nr:cold shock domain-containing protein [Nocardia sp. alder85J]MCX4091035.1 cold shock domain-containing protein [Nocardia sp. alder85J]
MTAALREPAASPLLVAAPPQPVGAAVVEKRAIRGEVVWYDEAKGFGFVAPVDGGAAVFVRHTALGTPGYRLLTAGQRITYTTCETRHGLEAAQVELVPPPDGTVPGGDIREP